MTNNFVHASAQMEIDEISEYPFACKQNMTTLHETIISTATQTLRKSLSQMELMEDVFKPDDEEPEDESL